MLHAFVNWVAAFLFMLFGASSVHAATEPAVIIDSGPVKGVADNQGIPYAAPPMGALHWEPVMEFAIASGPPKDFRKAQYDGLELASLRRKAGGEE